MQVRMTIKPINTKTMKKITILLLCCFCFFSSYSQADEHLEDDELLWQFSLGTFWVDSTMAQLVGAESHFSAPGLLIDAKIEYKNFYLNTHSGDFYGGSDLGYQMIIENDWGVDVIMGSYQQPFNENGYYDRDEEVHELKGIKEREADLSLGFAYYLSHGKFQTVAELVFDAFGESDGWLFHLDTTRNFELRNWDVWLNIGANYYSSAFIDYYYGIDADEATAFRPEYVVGNTSSFYVQLQADYPIAQSWVFSAGASGFAYSSHIVESPIVHSRDARVVFMGVKYVF
ncbi:MipA/OmpV family protein [Pseudoalteromonas phenolica]|nr:MipA/OmpV family protein [Pseudoalteromonas phenolica]